MKKIQKIHCILADKYVRNIEITNEDYRMIDEFIGNGYTVITSCIALLTQSGSNTKEIVMEKLRGLVE